MTAGAILAGGRSRRFGMDKARARWNGQTYLGHVVAAMRQAGLRPIYVVGGSDAALPEGVTHVADRWPGEGPLGGTISALLALHEDLGSGGEESGLARHGRQVNKGDVIVAACDLPRLSPGALLRLVEFAGVEPVVAPLWRQVLQPLCALYRHAALVSLAGDFAAGERSLMGALAHLSVCEVPFDDADPAFANVNTPEDALRLLVDNPPSRGVPD